MGQWQKLRRILGGIIPEEVAEQGKGGQARTARRKRIVVQAIGQAQDAAWEMVVAWRRATAPQQFAPQQFAPQPPSGGSRRSLADLSPMSEHYLNLSAQQAGLRARRAEEEAQNAQEQDWMRVLRMWRS